MRRLLLAFALAASVGCAGMLSLLPSPGQADDIRQTAARVADGIMVAEVALDQAGAVVDALPLSTANKDALDCAILKVNGHDAPSPTTLKVCGPIPAFKESPVGKALTALRTVSTRPGLCATVTAITSTLDAILAKLEAAGASVQTARVALGFTFQIAGGCK